MRLRLRLTLVLLAVNSVVLGALAWWTATDEIQRDLRSQSYRRIFAEQVSRKLAARFESEASNGVGDIVSWEGWREFEEVLLVESRVIQLQGGPFPVGAFLAPNGSRHRTQSFPMKDVLQGVVRAAESLEPTLVAGGICLPLIIQEKFSTRPRTIWGGVFVRPRSKPMIVSVPTLVVAAAIAATLLSGTVVYVFLGRAVVRPVERLSQAAEDFGDQREVIELPALGAGPEVDGLVRSFRRMRQRIQNFQSELEHEVEVATQAASEAERRAARQDRLAAMGTLAAGLAHEINSPLAGALHSLEVLRKEASGERAERYGELIEDALQRIRELVQRLLRLAPARIESGRCEPRLVFEDVISFLEGRLSSIGASVQVETDEVEVAASAGDLFPVILNLAQNACDALRQVPEEERSLHFAAKAWGENRVQLCLRDSGPGVDPTVLPRLFEPFVTTKGVGEGTGLGLALAHATVRQLGGQMEAENLESGGFQVRLVLPEARGD